VKVFQPSHIDPRIAAQSAWFSVHPYNREGKHYVSLIGRDVEGSVTRHWINAQSVLGIREELLNVGISPATLFPDLTGLSAAIELQVRLGRLHVPKPVEKR
jgi:hypothetical protein